MVLPEKTVALGRVFSWYFCFTLTFTIPLIPRIHSSVILVWYLQQSIQRRGQPHLNPRITNNTKCFGESYCLLLQCRIRPARLKMFFAWFWPRGPRVRSQASQRETFLWGIRFSAVDVLQSVLRILTSFTWHRRHISLGIEVNKYNTSLSLPPSPPPSRVITKS